MLQKWFDIKFLIKTRFKRYAQQKCNGLDHKMKFLLCWSLLNNTEITFNKLDSLKK